MIFAGIILASCQYSFKFSKEKKNTKEKTGWTLLFDGKTFNGWKRINNDGWKIKDGILSAESFDDRKQRDIITRNKFDNFELSLEFKISKMTNSGIKYLVTDDYLGFEGVYLGLEYQILDETNFSYPERGEFRTTASLYDLIPSNKREIVHINQWNIARIIVRGNHVEHWLNGNKVVEYERGSNKFRSLVAKSKYRNYMSFGEKDQGYILLQNEGTPIDFKDIKIKQLTDE
jgi:hypothetical protein